MIGRNAFEVHDGLDVDAIVTTNIIIFIISSIIISEFVKDSLSSRSHCLFRSTSQKAEQKGSTHMQEEGTCGEKQANI